MSLSISQYRESLACVASVMPPFALVPIPEIGGLLGSFSTLQRPEQVGVLRSVHEYLSPVEGVEARLLESVQQLAERLSGDGEPPMMMDLTVSTISLAWHRNLPAIEGTTADRPAPEASAVSSFTRPSTPRPPVSESAARLGGSLFTLSAVPTVSEPQTEPAEKASSAAPVSVEPLAVAAPAVEASEETDDASKLYPAIWWKLSKETRLDLKSRALGREGAVSVLNQSEPEHARFLCEVLTQWVQGLKESILQVKDRAHRAEAILKTATERSTMARELVAVLRERRRQDAPLATFFWKEAGDDSSLRLAVRRLSTRDIQSRLEGASKAIIDDLAFGIEAGILEHHLLPLFAGGIAASDSDDRQGQNLAEQLVPLLDQLPMTQRKVLSPEQTEHLTLAEAILRAVAAKLRENPDSALVRSFLTHLQGSLTRIPVIVGLIRRSRSEPA